MDKIKLSPSTLNIYRECKRCFWLAKRHKIARPRGIFPSLPGGMDDIIKRYFDECRSKNQLPGFVKDKIDGLLYADQEQLKKWRSWRSTDLIYKTPRGDVSGAIDELIVETDGTVSPFDYKTKGSAFKETPEIYSYKYYKSQMELYGLMLESSGHELSGKAYLNYFIPVSLEATGTVGFDIILATITIDTKAAAKMVEDAYDCLESEVLPEAAEGCEYCGLVTARQTLAFQDKIKK